MITVTQHVTGGISIHADKTSVENLKIILVRACNVWPDAPIEIKELHDMLLLGQLLQDYRKQPRFTRREELAPSENEKLDSWGSENKEAGA